MTKLRLVVTAHDYGQAPRFHRDVLGLRECASYSSPGGPLGVGTLDQIVDDLVALAGLGAVEVIIDPSPDAPRARDFGTERRQLLEVKDAYEQRTS